MIEEANVLNMIMYMPVEVETCGGTPSSIINGLKTLPPPNPNAPETHPPTKAKKSKKKRGFPWYLRSLAQVAPHRSFKACSRILMRTPM